MKKRIINLGDSGAELIISRLNNKGYQAYYVGGCVRDCIMGVKINDYDITTNCLPNAMLELFSDFTIFTAGIKHGTISVVVNHTVYEITTFRTESTYSDSRHPDNVSFCTDVHADLSRRDFTCNALAYNKNEGLIDDFNGFYDIQNKILRAVGNADERFEEDALRILRAVRFCSKLGFTVEPLTKKFATCKMHLLENVSVERIFSELKGILLGGFCEFALNEFKQIFEFLIPEFKLVSTNDYELIIKAISCANSFEVKLAIFLSSFNLIEVEKILLWLKCDNNTIYLVKKLLSIKDESYFTGSQIKRLLNKTNGDLKYFFEFKRAFAIALNDSTTLETISNSESITKNVLLFNECFSLKQLSLNGNDLLQMGLRDKVVGKCLNFLLFAVIDGKVENTKTQLLKYFNENFYD